MLDQKCNNVVVTFINNNNNNNHHHHKHLKSFEYFSDISRFCLSAKLIVFSRGYTTSDSPHCTKVSVRRRTGLHKVLPSD